MNRLLFSTLILLLLVNSSLSANFFLNPNTPKPVNAGCAATKFIDPSGNCLDSCTDFVLHKSFDDVDRLFCVSNCLIYAEIHNVVGEKIVKSCIPNKAKDAATTTLLGNLATQFLVVSDTAVTADAACTTVSLFSEQFGKFCLPANSVVDGFSKYVSGTDLAVYELRETKFLDNLYVISDSPTGTANNGYLGPQTDTTRLSTLRYYPSVKKVVATANAADDCVGGFFLLSKGDERICLTEAECSGKYKKSTTKCLEKTPGTAHTGVIYDYATDAFIADTAKVSTFANLNLSVDLCEHLSASKFYYKDGSDACSVCDCGTTNCVRGTTNSCPSTAPNADFYKKGTEFIQYVLHDSKYCDNHRAKYADLVPDSTAPTVKVCVSKSECISTDSAATFYLNENANSLCTKTTQATHTYTLEASVKLTEDHCDRMEGYLKHTADSTCLKKSACLDDGAKIVQQIAGVQSCLTATACPGAAPNAYNSICYDVCPIDTYVDGATCKPYSDCSSSILVDTTTTCGTSGATHYKLEGSANIYYTEAKAKEADLAVIKLTPASADNRIALWPSRCPNVFGADNLNLYIDKTAKECKDISECSDSGANCVTRVNEVFECKTGTRVTGTVFCTDMPDDDIVTFLSGNAITDQSCKASENKYFFKPRECREFTTTNFSPCENGHLLFLTSSATAFTGLECRLATTCGANDTILVKDSDIVVCISDFTSTATLVAALKTAYSKKVVNTASIGASTDVTTSKTYTDACVNSTDAVSTITLATVDYCISYDKCTALSRKVEMDHTGPTFSCTDSTTLIPLYRPKNKQAYISEANCKAYTDFYVRENEWDSNSKSCREKMSHDIANPTDNTSFSLYEKVNANRGTVIKSKAGVLTLENAATGLKKYVGDGYYYETCTEANANAFEHAGECKLSTDCIKTGFYYDTTATNCVAIGAYAHNSTDFLDMDTGVMGGSTCSKYEYTINANAKGCISAARAWTLTWFIKGNTAVATCDLYAYLKGSEKHCFTRDECVANKRGRQDLQRVTSGTNSCIDMSSCTDFVDFSDLSCSTDCAGKVSVTLPKKMCLPKCPLNDAGEMMFKNTDNSCKTTCDGGKKKVISTKTCETTCPAGTFAATGDLCLTSLECRSVNPLNAAELGGSCAAYSKANGRFLSSDYIWGNSTNCQAGNLFNTVVPGKPVHYTGSTTLVDQFELNCIVRTAACPAGTYPDASNLNCYSEKSAATAALVVNKEKTMAVTACQTGEVKITLDLVNRCVLEANFDTFVSELGADYFYFENAGVRTAVKECNTGDAAGYFRYVGTRKCLNTTQCGATDGAIVSSDAQLCIQKQDCNDEKAVLPGTPDQCQQFSTCSTNSNKIVFQSKGIECLSACPDNFTTTGSKCFTSSTCSSNNYLLQPSGSTYDCISRAACSTASKSVYKDGSVNYCLSKEECNAKGLFVDVFDSICKKKEDCHSPCAGCPIDTLDGYCFYTRSGFKYFTPPAQAIDRKVNVYGPVCDSAFKTDLSNNKCVSNCTNFHDTTNTLCFDDCTYKIGSTVARPTLCFKTNSRLLADRPVTTCQKGEFLVEDRCLTCNQWKTDYVLHENSQTCLKQSFGRCNQKLRIADISFCPCNKFKSGSECVLDPSEASQIAEKTLLYVKKQASSSLNDSEILELKEYIVKSALNYPLNTQENNILALFEEISKEKRFTKTVKLAKNMVELRLIEANSEISATELRYLFKSQVKGTFNSAFPLEDFNSTGKGLLTPVNCTADKIVVFTNNDSLTIKAVEGDNLRKCEIFRFEPFTVNLGSLPQNDCSTSLFQSKVALDDSCSIQDQTVICTSSTFKLPSEAIITETDEISFIKISHCLFENPSLSLKIDYFTISMTLMLISAFLALIRQESSTNILTANKTISFYLHTALNSLICLILFTFPSSSSDRLRMMLISTFTLISSISTNLAFNLFLPVNCRKFSSTTAILALTSIFVYSALNTFGPVSEYMFASLIPASIVSLVARTLEKEEH